ncbi:MAG: hypothetical protein QXT43_02040, partial [Candidatus Micrarchaeaceae archaeon]
YSDFANYDLGDKLNPFRQGLSRLRRDLRGILRGGQSSNSSKPHNNDTTFRDAIKDDVMGKFLENASRKDQESKDQESKEQEPK